MIGKALIFASVLAATTAYPLFKQAGQSYSNDKMGSTDKLIRSNGCTMVCVSMILNQIGAKINNKDVEPGSLNKWLGQNGGYTAEANFVWTSVSKFGLKFKGKTTKSSEIKQYND